MSTLLLFVAALCLVLGLLGWAADQGGW